MLLEEADVHADVDDTSAVDVRRDLRIPTDEPGVTLSADVYLPIGTPPCPALLTLLPYRKDLAGVALEPLFTSFVRHGYACVLVDLRGFGASDGSARPKMHPGEGDDAVAAIDWAATQPWCDGAVGMWGASSGGFTTLRAATRQPAPLRAILVIESPLDPGRDAFHHDGARVDLHQRVLWSGSMLVQQMLPPLSEDCGARGQQRWRDRLSDLEPFLRDFARHGPGDPALDERAIDVGSITVPTLCVGGWRDLYADAMTRLYEKLEAPKKLLVGPWFHRTPLEGLGGLNVALQWWDRWLRGIENRTMDEPPVALYVQGAHPGWHAFGSWPPPGSQLRLHGQPDETIAASGNPPCAPPNLGLEYRPDPTTGSLSGLWGIPNSGFGVPLDQHGDDCRALSLTSTELAEDLLICGRPEVHVRLSAGPSTAPSSASRVVIRLADVDQHGRSTFITAGVAYPDPDAALARIPLRATTYRVPVEHRLRVVLSDSDFPRLTPLPNPRALHVDNLVLTVPTVHDASGRPVDLPLAEQLPAAPGRGTRWTITRDPIRDGIEVALADATSHATPGGSLATHMEVRASVLKAAPEQAVTDGTHTANVELSSGSSITARAQTRCTQDTAWAHGELTIDGLTIWSKTWREPLTREGETIP